MLGLNRRRSGENGKVMARYVLVKTCALPTQNLPIYEEPHKT